MDADTISEVFDTNTLNLLLREYLICDERFIVDLDNTVANGEMKTMTLYECVEFLDKHIIGNTARTDTLILFILKHLADLYEKELSKNLDPYWRVILRKYLERRCV